MASPDGCPGTQMGALTYEPEHLGGEVGLLGAPAHTFHLSHERRRFKLAARSMRPNPSLGRPPGDPRNVVTTMMKADDPLTGVSMRTEIAKNSAPSPLFHSVTIFG
jgi:hypothetical protein